MTNNIVNIQPSSKRMTHCNQATYNSYTQHCNEAAKENNCHSNANKEEANKTA
jgi:hypothetical protein